MKSFKEQFPNESKPSEALAIVWLDSQIVNIPDSERLQWVRFHGDVDNLELKEGENLANLYNQKDRPFSFKDFLSSVALGCEAYFFQNGGKLTEAEQRFLDKMGY